MIRIAIVDDEEYYLQKERQITEDYFAGKGVECKVTVYQSAEWFVAGIQEETFDVYILDMEMPKVKGLEAAQAIRIRYPDPIIIFITNYMNYMMEAFEVNTWRYIPKQMLEEKLEKAYDALIPILQEREKSYLVVQKRGEIEKLNYSDIMYMRKEGKYTVIIHMYGECKMRKPLDEMIEELKSDEFMMIEKGFIINIKHVMKLKEGEVYMRDGMILPIRKRGITAVREALLEYWG